MSGTSGQERRQTVMRRFEHPAGTVWDVVVGRESWGAQYALFVPAGRNAGAVRQAPLHAASAEAAAEELDAMDHAALAALLDRSTLKES